jgi:signal peptidase I
MEPAVPNNSYRIILKCAYGIPKPFGSELLVQWKEPDAGDIVLFIQQNKSNVKRCCFTAGMSMEYLASDGYYIKAGSKKIPVEKNQYEKLKLYSAVPDDMIFVLGDNTETSIDSREYSFIPVETVLGKVLCR